MRVRLLIPDLFRPLDAEPAALDGLELPALAWLLGRGEVARTSASTVDDRLCEEIGVRDGTLPAAALTLLADGGDPGDGWWLHADPVHFSVGRDSVRLADARMLGITRDEADALTATLNRHFAEDGLVVDARRPQRWYLRLDAAPDLATTPLAAAAGRNIDPLFPTGADARRFVRMINEAQMLLFEHPVNEAREHAGKLPVNGVWPWGGGALPPLAKPAISQLWADAALAAGGAVAAGLPYAELPESGAAWLAAPKSGEHLVVLDALSVPAAYDDWYGWREAVQALDAGWLAPLVGSLQSRRLEQIDIVSPERGATRSVAVGAADVWKFWRRPRPLAALAGA